MLSPRASTPGSVHSTSPPPTKRGMHAVQNLHDAHGSSGGAQASNRQLPTTQTTQARNATINTRKLPALPEASFFDPSSDVDARSPPYPARRQRHQSPTHLSPSIQHPYSPTTTTSSPDGPNIRPASVDMPLTGDKRGGRSPDGISRGILSGWLPGSGTPTEAEGASPNANQLARTTSNLTPDSSPTRLRKSHTIGSEFSTPKNTASSSPSRFAFLASSMSAFTKSAPPTVSHAQDDELLGLDIGTALFPSSSATDRDAFSPAAFKNLESNAIGLLTKFQNAYRRQNAALREFQIEKEAQGDELEEADTRTKHLKLQLENMSQEAAEHQKRMQQLIDQLAAEKKLRLEDRIAREKGLPTDGSTISEDLSVDEDQHRRKWRKSAGFDTDEESVEDASVFSRSRSPTIAPSIFDGGISDTPPPPPPKSYPMGAQKPPRPPPQTSAFQRILKGISGDTIREEDDTRSPAVCRNCQGQDEQAAWNTVSLLRDENKGLKYRVSELETCVDGALDMINGVGLR